MEAWHHGGSIIQREARMFGFDHPTGIDLPGDIYGGGTIPDETWRKQINAQEIACRKKRHISLTTLAGCGYSDLRDFNFGDNASLAIGQGDVVASPLQVAIAYSAIENGGKVVRPHLGLSIESPGGELVQRIERAAVAQDLDRPVEPRGRARSACTSPRARPEGTSGDVFAGWDQARYPVYGKTGTASFTPPKNDQSWYVAYVPDPKRPIVVAVTVENGGFGAAVAAPITCQILAKQYREDPSKCQAGASAAR